MSRDTLSDLLRSVRLRGAVFYYVSFCDKWSAEAPAAREVADAVMPGCEHVMEYHMIAKGNGWAAVSGEAPVKLAAGDIVMYPQGDRHVLSSAPDTEPSRLTAEWVYAQRNYPKPMLISYHHGVVDAVASLPVEIADTIVVCGFLGCDCGRSLRSSRRFDGSCICGLRAGGWVARVIDEAVVESTVGGRK